MSDVEGPEDPEVARLREQLAAAERAAELRAELEAAQEEFRVVEDEIYSDAREAEAEQRRQQEAEADVKAERLRQQTSERLRKETWGRRLEEEQLKTQRLHEYQRRRDDFIYSPKGRFTVALVVLILIAAVGAGVLLSRPDRDRDSRWDNPNPQTVLEECVSIIEKIRPPRVQGFTNCAYGDARRVERGPIAEGSPQKCPVGTDKALTRDELEFYCLVPLLGAQSALTNLSPTVELHCDLQGARFNLDDNSSYLKPIGVKINDLTPSQFGSLSIDYGDGHRREIDDWSVGLGQDKRSFANLPHDYLTPGTYTIRVQLTDKANQSATDSCSFSWGY